MIGQTISHYRILEKLGEGGMGVVYKAEDTKLRRPVALKFLPPEMTRDEDARRRFIHEAQAASALDHPNIAVVHEIDETDDGRSFICMAYYEGETLKQKIERGPLEIAQAIEIAGQVADGLQRAHDAGIIHRDIKPANVIITTQGVVKIVDFGLAKLSGQAHSTSSGRHAGTAAYMSPEQVLGKGIDQRSDLFSLGIVLHEMVAGKRPFEGEQEAALFYTIAHMEPRPLSTLRAGVPEELEKIVLKLLQKDLSKRYQSASEVRADLKSGRLGAKSVSTSRIEVLTSAVKSHKLLSAVLVVGIPLLGILLSSLRSHSTISLEPADFAVIADFENNTNNKAFDHSLTEAMEVSLRQSARLNLLSSEIITSSLERMELHKDQPLNDSIAVSVARREGARIVIAGSISQLGTSYLLSCRIVDAVSGEVLDLIHRNVPKIENVLPEMDQLCEDIRNRLGESLRDISKDAMPLEKVTTSSLEALDLYSRGNKLQGQGDYQGAALLMEQAVAIDSTFAMAVSDLSYCHRKLGNDSLALVYHKRVLPLVGRATDRERYYILALYYGPSFEFDFPKAYESIQQLVVKYPNSADGFATLGWLAMYAGDTRGAIEADERALSLDSAHAGNLFDNSGYALALAGDPDRALDSYRKSKHLRPTYYAIDSYMAQAHWIKQEFDSTEAILQAILPVSDARRKILTHMELASLYYFEGRLERARDECRAGVTLCQGIQRSRDEAYFHYLLGELAAEVKDWKGYGVEMRKAEELSASPFPELPLIGSSYARNGKPGDAARILRVIMMKKSADPYFLKRQKDYYYLVDGEIMLKNNQPARAMEEFHSVQRIQGGDAIYLLAQLGIGRAKEVQSDTSAVAIYHSILDRRGEVVMADIRGTRNSGIWVSTLWPELSLALGKDSFRRHDYKSAEEHLRQCMHCWNKADGNYRKPQEAHKLLVQLTKGH